MKTSLLRSTIRMHVFAEAINRLTCIVAKRYITLACLTKASTTTTRDRLNWAVLEIIEELRLSPQWFSGSPFSPQKILTWKALNWASSWSCACRIFHNLGLSHRKKHISFRDSLWNFIKHIAICRSGKYISWKKDYILGCTWIFYSDISYQYYSV